MSERRESATQVRYGPNCPQCGVLWAEHRGTKCPTTPPPSLGTPAAPDERREVPYQPDAAPIVTSPDL
jgi:hypothetical protein